MDRSLRCLEAAHGNKSYLISRH